MLDLLKRCYKDEFVNWEDKVKEIIPSYGMKLSENEALYTQLNKEITENLKIN